MTKTNDLNIDEKSSQAEEKLAAINYEISKNI
jgi:hypothetical protein